MRSNYINDHAGHFKLALASTTVLRFSTSTAVMWPLRSQQCLGIAMGCKHVLGRGLNLGGSLSAKNDIFKRITTKMVMTISQLPKLCVKISILMHRRMWVRSFRTRLTSVTFAEDKVLIFLILRKNAKIMQL